MDSKNKKQLLQTYLNNTALILAYKMSESVYQIEDTAIQGDNLLTEQNMKKILYKHYVKSKDLGHFKVSDDIVLQAEEVQPSEPTEIEAMIDEAVKVDFKKEVEQLREIFGYEYMGD